MRQDIKKHPSDLEPVRPQKRDIAPLKKTDDLRDFATSIIERDQEFLRVFRSIERNSEDLQEELRILGFRLQNLKEDLGDDSTSGKLLQIMEDCVRRIDTFREEQAYLIALSTATFETQSTFDLLTLLRVSSGDWFPEKRPSFFGADSRTPLVLNCDRHWTRILLDRIFHHLNQDFTFSGDLEVRTELETPSAIRITISIANARALIRRGEEIPRLSLDLMRAIAQKLGGHFWIEKEKATEFRQFESEERLPDRTVEVRNFKKVAMCVLL